MESSTNIMIEVIIMRKREIVPTLSSFGTSIVASGSRGMVRGGHPNRQSPRGGKINILNEKARFFVLKKKI
jgi:hypothetical protein